jgi:hypothetical protein
VAGDVNRVLELLYRQLCISQRLRVFEIWVLRGYLGLRLGK